MKLRENLYAYPWESMVENNCNSYLLDGPVRTLIDPGHLRLIPRLEAQLAADGFDASELVLVIATHPHPDHCEGLAAFLELPALCAMHREALAYLEQFGRDWEQMTREPVVPLNLDFHLKEGRLDLSGNTLQVIETPGHAPGSVCLYWEEEKALFSGDVIFSQSVGRVDLPGGDAVLLMRSLERFMELEVELLLPGHGPPVEGKGAVLQNFYLARSLFSEMV